MDLQNRPLSEKIEAFWEKTKEKRGKQAEELEKQLRDSWPGKNVIKKFFKKSVHFLFKTLFSSSASDLFNLRLWLLFDKFDLDGNGVIDAYKWFFLYLISVNFLTHGMSTSRILLSKRSVLLSKNFNASVFSLSLFFLEIFQLLQLQFPRSTIFFFRHFLYFYFYFFLSYLNSKKEPICTNFSRFFQIFGTYQVFNMFHHARES